MADSIQGDPGSLTFLSGAFEARSERNNSPKELDLRKQVERHFLDHRDDVYIYLLACGSVAPDADDLTQEVFIRLYQHLRAGNRVSDLRPWLLRVARNLLLDWRKANQRKRATVSDHDWLLIQDTVPDTNVNLEQAALQRERHSELRRALQSLTRLQLQYLHLRASGLRYREIAQIYGVAVSGVMDVVHRAVERLGKEME
jgi:RNA polymerase sigma-70 factor (ECF subfamily)